MFGGGASASDWVTMTGRGHLWDQLGKVVLPLVFFVAVLLAFWEARSRQVAASHRCWLPIACNLELLQLSLYDTDSHARRCSLRSPTLMEAKRRCEMHPACGGVSRDAGLVCDGRRLPYELRSKALDETSSTRHRTGATRGCSHRYLANGKWREIKSWRLHRRESALKVSQQDWCTSAKAADAHELAMVVRRAQGVLKRTKLHGGLVTTARPRPKHPSLVSELHSLVGDTIVLEVVRYSRNRNGRPPVALLHQRVPEAWRGSRKWAAEDLDADELGGTALSMSPEVLCNTTMWAQLQSSWCILLDDVWTPLDCASEVLRSLARSCRQGLVLAPTLARTMERIRLPYGPGAGSPNLIISALGDGDLHRGWEQPTVIRRREYAGGSLRAPRRRRIAVDLDAARGRLQALVGRGGPLPTLVHQTRVEYTIALAHLVLSMDVPGDFVETGVWKGGTSIALLHALEQKRWDRDRRLFACDSFRGLPERRKQDSACQQSRLLENLPERSVGCAVQSGRGSFASTRVEFEANVKRFGLSSSSLHIIEGWFNETMPPKGLTQASFLRLDGDLYESTRDVLRRLYPKLNWGGVVLVDDYGSYPGCAKAVDEYLTAQGIDAPLRPIPQWDRSRGKLGGFEAVWWTKVGLCCGYASCAWCA